MSRPIITRRFESPARFIEEYQADLSKGGIFIPTTKTYPLRSPVQVSLVVAGLTEELTLEGEVVTVIPGDRPGVAIQFADLSPEQHARVQDLVKQARELEAGNAGSLAPAAPVKPVGSDGESVHHRIKSLSVNERIRLAVHADKVERAILLNDTVPQVIRLLLRNPQITESEIAFIARSLKSTQDVLKTIADNPKWIRNAEIQASLVKNIKTPLPIAMKYLPSLKVQELASLAKSKSVRDLIKRSALKYLEQRRSGGRARRD